MDKKRLIKNILTGILSQLLILIFNLINRRYLITFIGFEALGVINLFSSILGVVSIVELGISGIIPFCMYKAIIDKNNKKIVALYCLFSKIYKIILLVFFGVSLSLTPLLPLFSKNYSLDYNIYVLYIIYVSCISLSYSYTVKSCLISAYKNNYVNNLIHSSCLAIKYMIQILLLFFIKSLYIYVSIYSLSELLSFLIYYLYTHKIHSDIIEGKESVDEETKKEIKELVKSSFLHRFGVIFVYTIEGIIISAFIGIDFLAKYSNYIVVITALTSVAESFFTQLASVVGYAYYENDQLKFKKYFNFFYLFNYFISSFIFLCYFKCIPSFINMFFEEGTIDNEIIIVLTINRFISFMLHAVRLFKNSTGLINYDRWKCILEAVLNIGLAIGFVHVFGVIGVLLARIIADLFISNIVEPYVLYKHIFSSKPTKYYIVNYFLIAIFVGLLLALHFSIEIYIENLFANFIISGLYASVFTLPSFILLFVYCKKEYGIKNIIHSIIDLRKKKNNIE